jgi:hypothetical protein
MSSEASPLLKKHTLSTPRAAFNSFLLLLFVGTVLVSFTVSPRKYSELSTTTNQEVRDELSQHTVHRPTRHEILYQDWRGLSQEEEDTFTFVHSWSGNLLIGEKEEEHIDPKSLEIEFIDEKVVADSKSASGIKGPSPGGDSGESGSPARLSEIKSKMEKRYRAILVGESWTESQASALLSEHEDLCGLGLLEAQSPISCELDVKRHWALKLEPIGDDILIEGDTASVSVAGSPHTSHPAPFSPSKIP